MTRVYGQSGRRTQCAVKKTKNKTWKISQKNARNSEAAKQQDRKGEPGYSEGPLYQTSSVLALRSQISVTLKSFGHFCLLVQFFLFCFVFKCMFFYEDLLLGYVTVVLRSLAEISNNVGEKHFVWLAALL